MLSPTGQGMIEVLSLLKLVPIYNFMHNW